MRRKLPVQAETVRNIIPPAVRGGGLCSMDSPSGTCPSQSLTCGKSL